MVNVQSLIVKCCGTCKKYDFNENIGFCKLDNLLRRKFYLCDEEIWEKSPKFEKSIISEDSPVFEINHDGKPELTREWLMGAVIRSNFVMADLGDEIKKLKKEKNRLTTLIPTNVCKDCGEKMEWIGWKCKCKMLESEFKFPVETLGYMLERSAPDKDDYNLFDKLAEISRMKDINKMNRWFGYYQRVGEEHLNWTLDDIIDKVREERNLYSGESKDSEPVEKYITPTDDFHNYKDLEEIAELKERLDTAQTAFLAVSEERDKLKSTPRQRDKEYLGELRSKADCKKCDNEQADNVDTIEHGHPCFDCVGKAYDMDTAFLRNKNNFKLKYSEVCSLCTEKYGIGNMNCANPTEHKPEEYCRLEHVHDTPKKHVWVYNKYGKHCDSCGYTVKSELVSEAKQTYTIRMHKGKDYIDFPNTSWEEFMKLSKNEVELRFKQKIEETDNG